MNKIALIAVVILGATSANAVAGNINVRERNQAHRIFEGVKHNQLTFNEFGRLAAGQARVHALESRARSDGFVDPWERNRIEQAQNRQSARIFNLKHN